MKCPNCNETLLMSDKNGIEIDYCPSCRGIWLDRGELDKIIERSADPYTPKAPSQKVDDRYYGNDNQHRGKQYPKKKESFLGDLFDF